MPIISKEDFIKKQKSGKGITPEEAMEFKQLIMGINGVNTAIHKSYKKRPGFGSFDVLTKSWVNLIQRIINVADKTSADNINDNDFNQIERLQEWLGEKYNKTEYTKFFRTIDSLDTDLKAEFMTFLKKIDDVFEIGLGPIINSQSVEAEKEKEEKDKKLDEQLNTFGMTAVQQKVAKEKAMEIYNYLYGIGDKILREAVGGNLWDKFSDYAFDFKFFSESTKKEEVLNYYKKIVDFKTFLEATEDGYDKTNFQRIYECLPTEEQKTFEDQLTSINGWFNTGIDVNKLKSGELNVNKKTKKKAQKENQIDNDLIIPKVNNINLIIDDKKIDSEEARYNYESMLRVFEDAHKVAIYSDVCLGNLGFMNEKYGEISDMVKDLKKPLEDASKIDDQTSPAMAAFTIQELQNSINVFLKRNEKSEDKVTRKVCRELKGFKNFVDAKAPKANYLVNNKSFSEVFKEGYPKAVSGLKGADKKIISDAAEKQKKQLLKLIKGVKENYKLLKECNKYPENNSKQFNLMYAAVQDAAQRLNENSSLMDIRKIMGEVMKKAFTYDHKINSMGLRGGQLGVGKKKGFYRHYAAQELIKLAVGVLNTNNRTVDQYESLPKQIQPKMQKSSKKELKK